MSKFSFAGLLLCGLFLLSPSATLVGPSVAEAAEVKLAVVDMNRAMNEVKEGQAAKERLEKRMKERQSSLEEKGKEIEEMRRDLEKQAAVMNDETRTNRARELQEKMAEFDKSRMEAEREMAGLQNQLQEDLSGRLKEVVESIAKKDGYILVVEKAVTWYSGADDLTQRVIDAFDAKSAN